MAYSFRPALAGRVGIETKFAPVPISLISLFRKVGMRLTAILTDLDTRPTLRYDGPNRPFGREQP